MDMDYLNFTNETFPNDTMKSQDPELIHTDSNHTVKLIFRGFVLSTVALLGIIGNTLSIIVLLQKRMRSSSINVLLLGLQICDILFVTAMLLYLGLPTIFLELKLFQEYRDLWEPFIILIAYPTTFTAEIGSHYFTVLITLERYIAVCHPLHTVILCSRRRAFIASIIVGIFSILYGLPLWFERVVVYDESMEKYVWEQTPFDLDDQYNKYFIVYSTFIVMYVIPFVIIIVFNIAIYKQIRKSTIKRRQMTAVTRSTCETNTNESNKSLTFMLFAIVVTFIATNSFQLASNITIHIFELEFAWWTNWFIYPYNKCLITLNSSVNFLFYCAFGKQFRSELANLFHGSCFSKLCFSSRQSIVKNQLSQNSSTSTRNGSSSSISNQSNSTESSI